MSLMLKLSTITAIATSLLISSDFNVTNYIKNDLIKNPNIKVNSVKILGSKELKDHKDWKAYMVLMKLNIRGKEDTFPETIIVNEKESLVATLSTPGLYDYKQKKNLGSDIRPILGNDYYQDSHLIAGKKDAKHKLVVFSDPKCPFCMKYVPQIYKDVKEHPDTFALYYYHMPLLRLHPVSKTLTKAMEVLQKQGKIDDAMKMYNINIDYKETNETKILDAINKQFNLKLTKDEINKPEILEQLKKDKEMAESVMLRGTPTVYLDGKFDKEVTSYKKFIK